MPRRHASAFRRVDVFSASGGVGKTLIAIRLAQLQAKSANAPVLLIDADIGGPCLGDLLESWATPPWDATDNLLHLICGRPEFLPDRLRPGKLPVYRMREACPEEVAARAPDVVTSALSAGAVLFCPSHAQSTNPRVEPAVLHALLGHESAGGWIGYVIQQVIREASRAMNGRLGGVIVDHGGTLGALQSAALYACAEPTQDDDEGERHALVVTTAGTSALSAARDLAGRITLLSSEIDRRASSETELQDRIAWVVNRIPPGVTDWKEAIKRRLPRNDGWLDRALPVHADEALVELRQEADIKKSSSAEGEFEAIRKAVFG